MEKELITIDSGKINDYIHHIDLRQFATDRILSGYIAEFDHASIIFEMGSSFEVKHLLRYAKKNEIALSNVKYLITSHHHFDHCGGLWKLYEEIKKYNSNVKILTNPKTKEFLNNPEDHLKRAKRIFGNIVGEMKPIREEAYKLIEPNEIFSSNPNDYEIIDIFNVNGSEIKLAILKTPGHTNDHQSTVFIKNGKLEFIFLGESAGSLYHSSKLVTTPNSAPTQFNYNDYMKTLKNLSKLNPEQAGFSHFGVVNGKKNVREIISDHSSIMEQFRAKVIEYYNEKSETKYVCEKIKTFVFPRTDLFREGNLFIDNMILMVVYGMMMDLGYRKD
jgi:glyoxylase-like metal-dependent hydrolase (beta-lactamase superfamily II)